MAYLRRPTLLLLLLIPSFSSATVSPPVQKVEYESWPPPAALQTYIVHMNPTHKPVAHPTHAHWYASHLRALSIDPVRHLLYSYSALHAFAASLLSHHLPLLRSSPAVLHLHPDSLLRPYTTRSPEFLGLFQPQTPAQPSLSSSPLLRIAEAASGDVIIGVLDTGVWPESRSFDDSSMPEAPSRWRGACERGVDFTPSLCNRKLIGARSFSRGYRAAMAAAGSDGEGEGGDKPTEYASPRDRDGHGTHTASTAAGAAVANASLFGYAAGTARGMAPAARVAAYKVCWASGCLGSDILAGMDSAISDGVDVLSISLGGGSAPYFRDTIALGAFAATERGIFVACAAGNSGPQGGSLANTAPWITTVGAGTLDRDFPAYATLGNGARHAGVSLYSGPGMGTHLVPLVYEPPAASGDSKGSNVSSSSSNLCLPGTLDAAHVRGKVVLCDRGVNARVEKGTVVRAAGGVGMVLANTAANGEELVADSHLLPAVAVGKRAGDMIREYARSDPSPRAALGFGGTVLGVRPSPVVAAFSSRGPNAVAPQILKPDLIGPGVNILAGWSGSAGPTGLAKDDRRSEFNILSGTSMSCPHVSGIAALLKAAHPDWSPSVIKSALMTTAYSVDNTGSPLQDAAGRGVANPYAYGSGHVDPQKALSPGLVYNITTEDYIAFLCSLNYNPQQIQAIVKRTNMTCSQRLTDPGDLNYPSFSVMFNRSRKAIRYTRELTNVGAADSVYDVKIGAPAGINVSVNPTRLVFREVGQKLKYTITFALAKEGDPTETSFGWISWNNLQHQVRSPVACTWKMVQ